MAIGYCVCLFFLLIVNCVKSEDEGDFSVLNCYKKVDPGPCMALMQKWYFNATWNNCTKFNYGGCRGNENNFKSRHECEKKCLHSQGDSPHQSSHVHQQRTQRPCILALIRLLRRKQKNLLSSVFPGFYHRQYVPQCNKHGYFKQMQCNHNRKKCWCVDKYGNKKGKHRKQSADKLDCS